MMFRNCIFIRCKEGKFPTALGPLQGTSLNHYTPEYVLSMEHNVTQSKVDQYLGGTYYLLLQGHRVKPSKHQVECRALHYVPSKHSISSQKTVPLFVYTNINIAKPISSTWLGVWVDYTAGVATAAEKTSANMTVISIFSLDVIHQTLDITTNIKSP
jgi:hypothetical protein